MDLQRIGELGFENISIWYMFVLVLSFSFWWNIFLVAQCLFVFLYSTSRLAFKFNVPYLTYFMYFTDFCYLIEVVFTVSYLRDKRLKKLKFAKMRHWFFIMLDLISLVPVELMYTFHYVDDSKDPLIRDILSQNRSFRIYRIFLLEWFYMATIRKPWRYVLFTFALFFIKSLLLGHIFTCIWYNTEKSVECDDTLLNCYLWHEINMLNVVMLNWSGELYMFREPGERIIVTIAMLSGFFITFTYIYPYTFYFSILTGNKDSILYEKHKRLDKYISHKVENADLKRKLQHYFHYIWSEGEEDVDLTNVLKGIPLALRKDIFTDIYWEAFRHSDLIKGTSRNFKRSLSLKMLTEYHHDGDVVYFKGQSKKKMIFLVQGVLQVMAEENEESPLLSFSSGTIFGESSLFLAATSQAFVKCKGYCELQVVTYSGILETLRDYPKDRKLVFGKLTERLLLAKHTQWRKKVLKEDQKMEMLSNEASYFSIIDCVKWLKVQWRNCWEGHKRHDAVLKAKAEGTRLSSWRMPVRPEIKIEFISNYIELVVLSNMLEDTKSVVCLQTKFPWSIDPSTQFLVVWRYIILLTSFIPSVVYPYCTSWCDKFPVHVYLLSYVVTLIFLVDVLLMLMTAVRTRHETLTAFFQMALHNFQRPTFYLDLVAAFPYQAIILAEFDVDIDEAYKIGLLLHPAMVKSYVFFNLKAPLGSYVDCLTLSKNVITFALLLYWLAEFIQLNSVRNIFNTDNSWIDDFLAQQEDKEFLRRYFVSVFAAFVSALSVPSTLTFAESDIDLIVNCLSGYLFFVFSCFFMGSFYSSLVVKRFGLETFRILMVRLRNFLESKNVQNRIIDRIIKSMRFQWEYDNADFITSKVSLLHSMPYNVRRQVYYETTFKTLRANPLFATESAEYLLEILEISDCVAVPPGLVLVTYQHSSHNLIIINRGYCQLNSHLEKDVMSNLGRPIILGPTCAFPLLSSFSCVPSPITVVTVTDCELIVTDLNKLISIMTRYHIFQDIVEVMQQLEMAQKLRDSRPALMKICAFEPTEDFMSTKDHGWYQGTYVFLFKCYKFVSARFISIWSYFYMCYLILDCFFWPSCFGLFLFQFHILAPILITGRVFAVMHIFVHLFFPYYNKQGVMVTDPIYTTVKYLSSTFVLDVIRIIPVFPIYYYGFADPYEKPSVFVTLFGSFQCLLGVKYVVECIGFIGAIYNESYYTALIKLVVFLFLVFNMSVNFFMFVFATWRFDRAYHVASFNITKRYSPKSQKLLRENNTMDYYLYISYWVIAAMTTNEFSLQALSGLQLYFTYVLDFVGTILAYYVYVVLSSSSKFAHMEGAMFREQFFSVISYLDYEKADEKTIERLRYYYKYLWSKTKGENIKEIFGQLPVYLLEELWYPLYRPTFVKNNVFEDADEGFFRILATHVSSVFFTRGSLIIFKKETQPYIFFLHQGKCFVYDWFMILDMGSIIGDVHRSGIMLNKVYALTHVEMLKITSESFFNILNNFGDLEAHFMYVLKNSESFIKSDVYRDYQPLRLVDSKDAINAFELRKREIGFEDESHFEDPDNLMTEASYMKYTTNEKYSCVIYPNSWVMKLYTSLSFADVVLIALLVPWFIMFAGLTNEAFVIFAVLDMVWVIIVMMTFIVGLTDKEKGDTITNHMYIAKNYLKGAFAFDMISLLPLEYIPVAFAKSRESANGNAVSYFRLIKCFRVYSFYVFREVEYGLVRSEIAKRCLFSILLFLWVMVMLTAVFVEVTDDVVITRAQNDLNFDMVQLEAVLEAFLYMVNFITSSNVPVATLDIRSELLHFNASVILMVWLKGNLISSVLSLIYYRNLSTFIYKSRVNKLETFLKKKESSPILIKSAVNYQTNLFRFSRSDNMPSLLLRVPLSVRVSLMKELFSYHVLNCPLFEGLDNIFLDQLIARAKREVYFPGEKIVEQGDVDHRFYFIHTGEVYVISQTKERAYVEYVVGKMQAGEFFGESQGLWFIKPHTYTYRGRTLVEIIVLHSDDWVDLRKTFPHVSEKILEKAKALRYI